jgi:hypothetical protein
LLGEVSTQCRLCGGKDEVQQLLTCLLAEERDNTLMNTSLLTVSHGYEVQLGPSDIANSKASGHANIAPEPFGAIYRNHDSSSCSRLEPQTDRTHRDVNQHGCLYRCAFTKSILMHTALRRQDFARMKPQVFQRKVRPCTELQILFAFQCETPPRPAC